MEAKQPGRDSDLRRGQLRVRDIWALGVGIVVCGQYFGWNLGLKDNGPVAMLIASLVVCLLFLAWVLTLSELSVAMPRAGGPLDYGCRAGGPWLLLARKDCIRQASMGSRSMVANSASSTAQAQEIREPAQNRPWRHRIRAARWRHAGCTSPSDADALPGAHRPRGEGAMKRILVALDSSPRAPTVLAAALHLAAQADAQLVIYRAIGVPPDFPRELFNVTDLRLEDVLLRNAHTDLERLIAAAPRERIEKIATAFATPWDGICAAARTYDVDLIVLGSHGCNRTASSSRGSSVARCRAVMSDMAAGHMPRRTPRSGGRGSGSSSGS